MNATISIETQFNNLEDLRLPELQACFKQVVGKATRAPNRKFLIRKIREAAAQREDAEESTDPPKASPDTSPSQAPVADPNPSTRPEMPAAGKGKASTKLPPAKKTRRSKKASAPAAPPPKPEPTILMGPLGSIKVSTHAPKKLSPTKKTKKAPIRVAPQPAAEPEPESEVAANEVEPTSALPQPELKALSVSDLRRAYVAEVGRPTKSTNRNYLIWKIRQARQGKVPVGPVSRTRSDTGGTRRVLPLRMHDDTIDALDDVWRRHGLSSRMDMFRCALHLYLTSLDEHEAAALVRR